MEHRALLPSLFEILKPAVGPSSSHTFGPLRAGERFRRLLEARRGPQPGGRLRVTLCGSLARTGRGHLTDLAVTAGLAGFQPDLAFGRRLADIHQEVSSVGLITTADNWFVFRPDRDILFDTESTPLPHPNTLCFTLSDLRDRVLLSSVYLSVGGGRLVEGSSVQAGEPDGLPEANPAEAILESCRGGNSSLVDYVLAMEANHYGHSRSDVMDHLSRIWESMYRSIEAGLSHRGCLPGGLRLERRAAEMRAEFESGVRRTIVSEAATRAAIYAIAVAEENADGGSVVTAPTCGSAGVVPACLRVAQETLALSDGQICEALAVAGLVGALAVAKASIAGALVGCQGEIGVASAMAAAAVCYLLGGNPEDQIDRAAETALEHYLGLTCDPVDGLVQIPCIERNAAGAVSALNAANLAMISGGRDRVSFDATLEAMRQTGLDMSSRYKETSLGGLAAIRRLDRNSTSER
jgi:L-serine dehydratase